MSRCFFDSSACVVGKCLNGHALQQLSRPCGKSGASGEIRTLKRRFLRQAAIPIRARWHLVHRGGFEPPRPTWGDRVTAGPFRPGSRTCANLAKVDESNARRSSRRSGFQDQLPTIQQYLPRWRRVRESNPLASCENPCLADKCLTGRSTLRLILSKNDRILVGPVGFEPTRRLLLRQLRMPVPPRAWKAFRN
jgi:hypothetical protein